MQLRNCFLIICVCSACVVAEEVCVAETFNASCSAGQVVFFETAFYGRRINSRCFNVTENETECSVDLRQDMQKRFGLKQHIQFTVASEYFTTKQIKCLNSRMPFLDISHQCANLLTKEVCSWETFNAHCPTGTVISINRALYGRMRSSRCIQFVTTGLNCHANVQPYLESLCNDRSQCQVKTTDDKVRLAESSCQRDQPSYLEVDYACVHGFSCSHFNQPIGAKMDRNSEGYDVLCPNKTTVTKLICRGESWNIDPQEICSTNGINVVQIVMFSLPAAILLVSIVSVTILLHRMQKKAQRTRTTAEDEYVDYPESHLRRNGATCNSEYDEYGEIDDCGYESYSEVRNTGP